MAKADDLKPKKSVPDSEDAGTLAAIDEGLRDAKAGRTTPIEEVRKRMPQWITESTSRKDR